MKEFNLRLFLKTFLPKMKCKPYLQWLADTQPHLEGHHILGKDWDYMIAKITPEEHKKVHAKTPDCLTFEELVANALTNLARFNDYILKRNEYDDLSKLF